MVLSFSADRDRKEGFNFSIAQPSPPQEISPPQESRVQNITPDSFNSTQEVPEVNNISPDISDYSQNEQLREEREPDMRFEVSVPKLERRGPESEARKAELRRQEYARRVAKQNVSGV